MEKKYSFTDLPQNSKHNLCLLLENIYGEDFSKEKDKLASLIKANNSGFLDLHYLTVEKESTEFESKNFSSIIKSLDYKVEFIRKAVNLLLKRKLKIPNKNRYAIFVDVVNNPVFTFIGWLATILGLGAGLYAILISGTG